MPKKEIKEKIIKIVNETYRDSNKIELLLDLFSQQEKEILEELLKELPRKKEYQIPKDLKGNLLELAKKIKEKTEWSILGFNQALIEIKNLIKRKLKCQKKQKRK